LSCPYPTTTAIIDIGSNSARLVIYQQSSAYGFHLICERKSKVRIGEDAYERGGYLQPIGINRAYLALNEFINTIQLYAVDQTICVATSALRDAPNGKAFVQWIKAKLGLEIHIIDGNQEARYGALAAVNLLPIEEGITIDIGGGSSDLALIKNAKIVDTYSLNIGSVRLKELFFDKGSARDAAQAYIQKELQKLPKAFHHPQAIGIGGTARSISKGIMKKEAYPLNKLHAFSYRLKHQQDYIGHIATANRGLLPYLHISKGRFDTIREGALIFQEILQTIGAKRVITSGVGVREGVFLDKILAQQHHQFPPHINPSIQSMLDRFKTPYTQTSQRQSSVQKLFDLFLHQKAVKRRHLSALRYAVELTSLGYIFNIYNTYEHAFYITMQEFNYGVTHQEIILTAMLLRFGGKRLYEKEIYKQYKSLLPKKRELTILSFIYTMVITLHENAASESFEFKLKNRQLTIQSKGSLYLAKERIREIECPKHLHIKVIDYAPIPAYQF